LTKQKLLLSPHLLEIIQRIGPCNAKVKVEKIEDVRISKRSMVIERAKELLRTMMDLDNA
jgi:DNA primase